MSSSPSDRVDGAVCPVDHKSREAWLRHAQTASSSQTPTPPPQPAPQTPPTTTPTTLPAPQSSTTSPLPASCDSSSMASSPLPPPSALPSSLATDRQISTIPRSFLDSASSTPAAAAAAPNAESPTDPHTSPSGHWVYPSEAQFFAAMARKAHTPRAADMPSIIPIHNAVNERTWGEILEWERGRGGEACGGPRLVSFAGDASRLTPRARVYGWMGYAAPFDRHDWVVDRCGRRVDYVIDFYQGKSVAGDRGLSFYLDVRPKLNTFEGWRLRFARFVGF